MAQAATSFSIIIPSAESIGATNRRFTTYDRSVNTGLDYALNRHYDSQQGRFTQVDPIAETIPSIKLIRKDFGRVAGRDMDQWNADTPSYYDQHGRRAISEKNWMRRSPRSASRRRHIRIPRWRVRRMGL